MIQLTIDGQEVQAPAGSTLRSAALAAGLHTPTLCWHPHFPTGSNCRACVVELSGSRVLVPSCSRLAADGMVVRTESTRVRRARRLVLELLLGQVDLVAAPELQAYARYYGADPVRFAAAPEMGRGAPPGGAVIRDNPFFVRDYARCILCQRCTAACGTGVQFTFAIAVVGRGAKATIGSGGSGQLPDSPCVYCGNCVGVCPTGALLPLTSHDALVAGRWAPAELAWSPQAGFTPVPSGGGEG